MGSEEAKDWTALQADGLFAQLYASTKPAHQALERSLRLLQKPVTASRIERALKKFLGFHLVWESTFTDSGIFSQLMAHRRRAPFAASDLEALGWSRQEIANLPLCNEAATLHRSEESAMGSLYVMEGSTLGGAVIATALRDEPWIPPRGLEYFSPPGRHPRDDWNELKTWAEARFEPATWPLIEQGAQETFTLINAWQSTP